MKYSDGKKKKVIAVCMAQYFGYDQMELIKSLNKSCCKHDCKFFVFASSTDFIDGVSNPSEEQVFDLMEPEKFDAVVVMTDTFKVSGMAQRIADKVIYRGVPCISLLEELNGCINLLFDYASSFETVVRHVIEVHKPKHVNFIAGIKDNPYSETRLDVFKKVMAENSLTIEEDRIGYGNFWENPTAEVVDRFLASKKKIDAIICANDIMAIEVCRKLKEVGIRVPEDIIVSGFDGVEFEKYHFPRLTTAAHDTDEMSEMICEIIESATSGMGADRVYNMNCSFRASQSCGCVDSHDTSVMSAIDSSFYNVYGRLRNIENDIGLMYSKAAALGRLEKFSEVLGDLNYLVTRFFPGSDVSILFNDDFLNNEFNLWDTLLPEQEGVRYSYYTETMRVALENFNGELLPKRSISGKNIVPECDELIEKDGVLMFTPQNCMGNGIGYMVVNFDPLSFNFFMYYSFITGISNILNSHKSTLDQFNLYSTDQLTKLLNRKGFYKHTEGLVNEAVEKQLPLTVISLDLNGLKMINDTYGHKEGDFALAKVGEVLKRQVSEMGITTRFGGDEFAAAVIGEDSERTCRIISMAIADELDAFNKSGKKPYPISASIGFSTIVPKDKGDFERLLNTADESMYKRKQAYKMMHDMNVE